MYDLETIRRINETDPGLARLMVSSREFNRIPRKQSMFRRWLHETDPWAFRVSDAVFTLVLAGITALAFVTLPVSSALCMLPVIILGWIAAVAMNHH